MGSMENTFTTPTCFGCMAVREYKDMIIVLF
jgi:hypothetical protein